MRLSAAQVAQFSAEGYLHIPSALTPPEVHAITEAFEQTLAPYAAGVNVLAPPGAAADRSRRTQISAAIQRHEGLCSLLDHPAVVGLIGGIIGSDFNYTGACLLSRTHWPSGAPPQRLLLARVAGGTPGGDGNFYVGDTGWHPDGGWGELFAVKLAVYLDDLTADTGCLRVIPGSHRPEHPVRTGAVRPNEPGLGVAPKDCPGMLALETSPGDLVLFNHDLYHSSWGGGNRRRMFTLNCTKRARTEADFVRLRRYLTMHSPGGYRFDAGAGAYWPLLVDTATPAARVHLQQVGAIHDALFPECARGATRPVRWREPAPRTLSDEELRELTRGIVDGGNVARL